MITFIVSQNVKAGMDLTDSLSNFRILEMAKVRPGKVRDLTEVTHPAYVLSTASHGQKTMARRPSVCRGVGGWGAVQRSWTRNWVPRERLQKELGPEQIPAALIG